MNIPPTDQPRSLPPAPAESIPTVDRPGHEPGSSDLGFLQPPGRPDSLGRLGHYEVLEVLGKGGFGIVFRAYDEVLQRVVAIKVLATPMAATSPARNRFLREARAAAQIRHENVVQIHAIEEQPLPYLVMEFIPGETLQQRLDRRGPLDVDEVTQVGRQIAEGLAAAHAAGLIHRDIKPGNILLEEGQKWRVKITDFGLARAADDASLTQSGVVAGTPLYMSPEQARGDTLSHHTDLFSLGSVLYAITTAQPPFRAGNTLAVLKRVAEQTPRPIPEIVPETPAWLCWIIAKLMAKDACQRFQTASEVSEALEAGLTAPGTVVPALRQPATRSRRLLPAFVLGLVAALAVASFLLTRPGPQQDPVPKGNNAPTAPALAGRKGANTGPRFVYPHVSGDREVAKMSKDRRWLAAASGNDGAVELFDAATGAHLRTLPGPGGRVFGLTFSADGNLLAAMFNFAPVGVPGRETAVRVWDVTSRSEQFTKLQGPNESLVHLLSFSPDGKYLVAGRGKPPACIYLWDARTGAEVKRIATQKVYVRFSPDGALAVSYNGIESELIVWNPAAWKPLRTLRGPGSHIIAVEFSPDGRLLAGASPDRMTVWNVGDFAEVQSFGLTHVLWFDFLPDNKTILSLTTNEAALPQSFSRWDAATGKKRGTFSVARLGRWLHVSLSDDRRDLLVVDSDTNAQIRVLDPVSGNERRAPAAP